MLKYKNTMVVFAEIPDCITLAINITNCPCHCPGCHSPELWQDTGTDLTLRKLQRLIKDNPGIDCVCFMGGDSEPDLVNMLAECLHPMGLKAAWYSGRDEISDKINVENFDYIKIGHYDKDAGPLTCPTTNQKLYQINQLALGYTLQDITKKLQK